MASSRLKKKIDNAEQGAYGNLNESFVSVGTPLPSLATTKKDSNEFKPVWEQEVYDEQGRRRLHGAFTGGFSAGYFNSVGSKEGWTPSTFKSSRNQRASNGNRNVADAAKDFMDDEDLAELASSRTLETSSTYSKPSAPPAPTYDPLMGLFGDVPPPSLAVQDATAALASLIEPSSTRVGAKLMRKMGWRDGQGVGPRVTFSQRKKQAFELGVKLGEMDGEDDGEGEASKHYFAPLDRPLASLESVGVASDRGWGLGYKAGPTLARATAMTSNGRGKLGVDLDDPYGDDAGPGEDERRAYRVMEIGDEDDDDYRMSGTGSHRQQAKAPSRSGPGQSFHDGNRVLSGFTLENQSTVVASTSQLPPPPPRGWQPNPRALWAEPASSEKGKGRQLDAEERGTLLGEPAPPPVPKSVFDYLSSKAKERLASVTTGGTVPSSSSGTSTNSVPLGSTNRFGAPSTAPPPPPEPDVPLYIPPLDVPTALSALKGFQPFSSSSTSPDPVKQARYTLYLQHSAQLISSTSSGGTATHTLPFGPRKLPTGLIQTIAELNRELMEYNQAAKVFKPVSGMLAGRFTSGGAGGTAPKVEPGLFQPVPKGPSFVSGGAGDGAVEKPVELTPAQKAVRDGNFGSLTRSTTSFRPAKLVCKRFGVPDPWKGGGGEDDDGVQVGGAWGEATKGGFAGQAPGGGGVGELMGQASMDAMMQSSGFRKFQNAVEKEEEEEERGGMDEGELARAIMGEKMPGETETGRKKRVEVRREVPTIETVGLGDDEQQGEETLTYTKAPKDIFAAIFADSDDEDDDDDDDEDTPTTTTAVEPVKSAILPVDPFPPPAPAPSAPDPPPPDVVDSSTTILDSSTVSDFRPSFVPTSSRTTIDTDSKKKDKKKKRKTPAATLSFDVDEGVGGDEDAVVVKKRKKSSGSGREKKEKVLQEEEEDMWEEKAPTVHPDVLRATTTAEVDQGGKGRTRASDLF